MSPAGAASRSRLSRLESIVRGVGGDFQQPGRERDAAPLEARQIGQRPVKHLGGNVLGLLAAARVLGGEGIDPLEVALIEVSEPARIALSGFYRYALGGCFVWAPQVETLPPCSSTL